MTDVCVLVNDEQLETLITCELVRTGKSVGKGDCTVLITDGDATAPDFEYLYRILVSRNPESAEGFDATLRRPIYMNELRDTVTELLDAAAKAHETPPASDTLSLSDDRKFAFWQGKRTVLTEQESALLACLSAHRNETVGRSELNAALGAGGNSSDVYVCILRKKLSVNGLSPIITVRNKGYMIR